MTLLGLAADATLVLGATRIGSICCRQLRCIHCIEQAVAHPGRIHHPRAEVLSPAPCMPGFGPLRNVGFLWREMSSCTHVLGKRIKLPTTTTLPGRNAEGQTTDVPSQVQLRLTTLLPSLVSHANLRYLAYHGKNTFFRFFSNKKRK